MTKREITGRFKGSVFGMLWAFLTPIMMLAVYTFVFSVVFKARWHGGVDENKSEFAIMLFTGMIVYSIFAECINRAPSLVVGNPNYVKRVIFPLHIMPWIVLGTASFNALISFIVLLAFFFISGHSLAWTVLYLPLVLAPLFLIAIGLSWFLSSLGVYLRDVNQTVSILTTVLMFLSPVFYPLSNLPPEFQFYLRLNPLTPIIEQTRQVLILGQSPDLIHIVRHIGLSALIAWLGFAWFQKTRKGFADVI
jgi:lipopolysaccharide transport system permease protein